MVVVARHYTLGGRLDGLSFGKAARSRPGDCEAPSGGLIAARLPLRQISPPALSDPWPWMTASCLWTGAGSASVARGRNNGPKNRRRERRIGKTRPRPAGRDKAERSRDRPGGPRRGSGSSWNGPAPAGPAHRVSPPDSGPLSPDLGPASGRPRGRDA